MALNSVFGKKDNDSSFNPRPPQTSGGAPATMPSGVTPPVSSMAVPSSMQPASSASSAQEESGAKLTVGPNIKLKGVEITDCDTLVVEGTVEATMDSRVIQIAETGAFKGSAEIDIAEIRGTYDGDLTVRERLVIFSTGKVTGKVRYGKIVIEEGGQLSGEISFGTSGASAKAKDSKDTKDVAPSKDKADATKPVEA